MDQIQPPTPDNKQEQGCCCFKQFSGKEMFKGIILVLLGLIIAIPSIGHMLSRYFHVFLGAFFVAVGIYVLLFKYRGPK